MGKLTKFSLQLHSENLTGTKLSSSLDAIKLGQHNLCWFQEKYISKFLECCADGAWLRKKLQDADLTHDEKLCNILECTIHYIGESFQRNELFS